MSVHWCAACWEGPERILGNDGGEWWSKDETEKS